MTPKACYSQAKNESQEIENHLYQNGVSHRFFLGLSNILHKNIFTEQKLLEVIQSVMSDWLLGYVYVGFNFGDLEARTNEIYSRLNILKSIEMDENDVSSANLKTAGKLMAFLMLQDRRPTAGSLVDLKADDWQRMLDPYNEALYRHRKSLRRMIGTITTFNNIPGMEKHVKFVLGDLAAKFDLKIMRALDLMNGLQL